MDAVDQALASLDEVTARCAEPAVNRLFGPPGERMPVEGLTRLELQDFLWSKLPTRFVTGGYDHHEIAWALGDLLDALQRPQYAALCRDRRTHEILALWHRDHAAGAIAAAEAVEASGVLPPDTSTLAFGDVMGGDELRVYLDLSAALEAAVDMGAVRPGSASFERDRVRAAEEFWRNGNALSVVRRNRAEVWAAGFRADPDWLAPALSVLEQAWSLPENVELSLVPARALLETVGGGVNLTAAGYLPAATAVELNDHFRWVDVVGRPPKKEGDLPQLTALREHLSRQRLLAVRKGVLSTTAKGRACLEDDEEFWARLTDLGPRWGEFAREVIAVSAALLVMSPDAERQDLSAEVAQMVQHRWKGGGDLERDVHWCYIDWYRVGFALGWWEARRGRWLDRLSPRGVGAASRAFWSVAAAPPTYRD
ncbi:MAG TPA: hypothetical protein VLI04_14075 [Nocardioidaceae bacterium]|nr:hypothetical protein [Nocardioidaceae bacterium]